MLPTGRLLFAVSRSSDSELNKIPNRKPWKILYRRAEGPRQAEGEEGHQFLLLPAERSSAQVGRNHQVAAATVIPDSAPHHTTDVGEERGPEVVLAERLGRARKDGRLRKQMPEPHQWGLCTWHGASRGQESCSHVWFPATRLQVFLIKRLWALILHW